VSASAFAIVLLAGLIHAGWNIVAKRAGGDARFAFFTSVVMMVAWAPLGLWMARDAVPGWDAAAWAAVGASGALHVAYFVALLRGYRAADLTVVYPVARGSAPLLSSAVAVALLGERLSPVGVLGIAGVVGGVFLIAGGPALLRVRRQDADPAVRRRLQAGIGWGLATGGLIAAYTVVDGYAVKVLLLSPVLVDWVGNFARVGLLAPAALRDRAATARLWRLQWRHALLVGAIGPVSYVMVLYALQTAPLSHVAPAREVSMLFAALLGGRLLGEGDRRARLLGALCIAGSVAALGLG
jgi:drug/metabolite transporter (DMT)-like permease